MAFNQAVGGAGNKENCKLGICTSRLFFFVHAAGCGCLSDHIWTAEELLAVKQI
jgi:hypothetical protein